MDLGSVKADDDSLSKLSFGLFEVDLQNEELSKSGRRIKLQSQPFQILAALLEKPGTIVTRDQLRYRIWGNDTIVDFDQSLSTAITKVREALGDSSDNPRFIETVPRKGYRFIAPISAYEPTGSLPLAAAATQPLLVATAEMSHTDLPVAELSASSIESGTRQSPGAISKRVLWMLMLCSGILMLAGVLLGHVLAIKSKGDIPALRQLTFDGRVIVPIPIKDEEQFPSMATDGVHIFTTVFEDGHTDLVQTSVNGGESQELVLPDEIVSPSLGDISSDNSKLLVISHPSPRAEMPLWRIRLGGNLAQRVSGVLAHDATWMPNGSDILFATNNELQIFHAQSGTSELFVKTPGRAFWLRWSPDGKRLRFTVIDSTTHSQSIWELTSSDHTPRPLLNRWSGRSNACCGVWMHNGSSFIFQSARDNESDLWRLSSNSNDSNPERLTNGPLYFGWPAISRSGDQVFLTGIVAQNQVQALNSVTKEFQPYKAFLRDTEELDFSRDRQWVAWVDGAGRLWRARTDGRDQIQLTPDALSVYMMRWSSDNSRIAMMARKPNQPWQLYLIRSDGSGLEQLLNEQQSDADPTWSPDGRSLAFGRPPDNFGGWNTPWVIRILDMQTRQVQPISGSEGLFSPRWSPDGRYIVALTQDQKQLVLFDRETRQWKRLAAMSFLGNPIWAADSRAIYVQDSLDAQEPILHISVPDGNLKRISTLANFRASYATDYVFLGLAPDDVPVVRTSVNGDIYSLNLFAIR
jgi:Tol biopolymer transport system component/DNA-binding winged helix-turn-helix (wHTH) protein